jgi:hypothetical protein
MLDMLKSKTALAPLVTLVLLLTLDPLVTLEGEIPCWTYLKTKKPWFRLLPCSLGSLCSLVGTDAMLDMLKNKTALAHLIPLLTLDPLLTLALL